jgi:hypothetical protein
MNKDQLFLNNEPSELCANWDGKPVIDIGLRNRCAWASAKALIEGLIHGQGEVSFGEMPTGKYSLPTLDLFLDEPSKLKPPEIEKTAQGEIYFFKDEDIEIGLLSSFPEKRGIKGACLAVTKDTGLAASVFRAFLKTVETIDECGRNKAAEIVWGWSAMLLAPLCDSLALTLERQEAVAASGSIVSLWLRSEKDDGVKALMKNFSSRGELRLQNLKTGNTFIFGSVDEEACGKAFGIA